MLVACPQCLALIHSIDLARHIADTHCLPRARLPGVGKASRGDASTKTLVQCPDCTDRVSIRRLLIHMREQHHRITTLRPMGKNRGSLYKASGICGTCGSEAQPLWRLKTTRRTVFVCSVCRPEVVSARNRGTDALDRATTGGGFEQNRRKH